MSQINEEKDARDPEAEYNAILWDWQKGVYKLNLYIIIITVFIEIGFMFVLDAQGIISVPIPRYIPRYIVKPTVINLITYVVAIYLNKDKRMSPGIKAMMPLIMLTVVVSNLIVVHYVFGALYMTIVVPIYMSSIYGDSRITRRIFWLIHPVYVIDVILILLTPYKHLPTEFFYNVAVAYLTIPLSYILVKNIVEYENKKEQLIRRQEKENDRLREEIRIDGLTEIYNHTGLFEYLDEKIDNWKEGDDLHICVLDIDYFKQVNDDYGHETGNVVLRNLGRMMKEISNENIFPARYGGEEFTFVFTGMDKAKVLKVLREFHGKFAKQTYPGIKRAVTFSAGIAAYEAGMTDQMFFEKADKALYKAKDEGRNRILVAE